jgi:hypothetical protein
MPVLLRRYLPWSFYRAWRAGSCDCIIFSTRMRMESGTMRFLRRRSGAAVVRRFRRNSRKLQSIAKIAMVSMAPPQPLFLKIPAQVGFALHGPLGNVWLEVFRCRTAQDAQNCPPACGNPASALPDNVIENSGRRKGSGGRDTT